MFSLAMHFYCGTRWRRTTMNAPSISRLSLLILPLLIATRVFFFFCGLFPSVTLAPIFLFFCRAKKEEDSALFFHECLNIFPLSLFPHLRSPLLHFFSQPKKSWERFPRPSSPPLTVAKMLLERGGGGGKGVVKSEKVRIWGRGVSAKQPVFCGRRKEGGISSYHTGTRKKERQNTFLKICVGDCRS